MEELTFEQYFFDQLFNTDKYLPLHGVFGLRNRLALDKKTFIEGHVVFLILDKNFKVLYKADPAYKKGNYTKTTNNKMVKYGLVEDGICKNFIHTENNMDVLLDNLYTTIHLEWIYSLKPKLISYEERLVF